MTTFLTYTVLQTLLMIYFSAVAYRSQSKKLKHVFKNAAGASIFQPYYDIIKLLKKPRRDCLGNCEQNI